MVSRLCNLSKSNSFFLFGNRGVGKSTLLEQHFPRSTHFWIDLLDPATEKRLALRPELLDSILEQAKTKFPKGSMVVIDEIQKIPKLLDVVHSHIEKKYFKFALTGSSARKLKISGTNLLAGRAFINYLHPLTYSELGPSFDLLSYLRWGALPQIFSYDTDQDKIDYLNAYTDTYLREEIVAEQLIRNITPFRHFLEVAAQSNAKIVNFTKIANAIDVETTTVQNYFSILEDTFIGILLQPFHESIRNRQRKNPKFYYFDTGVVRSFQNKLTLPLAESSYEFGDFFEQFIIMEFMRLNTYHKKSWRFSYLMTKDDVEVDLIIERPGKKTLFIEIKSTDLIQSISAEKLTSFKKLCEVSKGIEALVISRDPIERKEESIRFIHWKTAFDELKP